MSENDTGAVVGSTAGSALIRRCNVCGAVTAVDLDVTEENMRNMVMLGQTVTEVDRLFAKKAWLASASCNCEPTAGGESPAAKKKEGTI